MSDSRWPQIDVLEQLTSPRRLERIDGVLDRRIVSVTAVFEDIFDPHNVSAGLRTCEGYGLADVHVITQQDDYKLGGDVAASSSRWLNVHRYRDTPSCIDRLRDDGFAIWVSDLEAEKPLAELPVAGKIALIIGHEHTGISETMRAAADQRYILPMQGMVQSFNLSVALAISLQTVVSVRREQLGGKGDMDLEQQWQMRRRWLEFPIRNAKLVRREYGETEVDQ